MIGPRGSKDDEVFADALEGRGPRNSDIQELVHFAENLCRAAVDPSPDFVLNLRAELMADAATVLVVTHKQVRVEPSQPIAHPVRRRLAAATAGVLATAGMVGIVASSAQAVPGEMLYPVKRGVESIELTLHRSDAGRGSFELSQATERLAEAQTLAAEGNPRNDNLVVKSLSDFADTASAGSESLFSDYISGGNDASIDKVNSFATSSSTMLSDLSGNLSPDASEAYKTAALTVTGLASQASNLCNACATAELRSLAQAVAAIVKDTGSTTAGTDKPVTTDSASTTTTKTTAPKSILPSLKPPVISISPSPPPSVDGNTTVPLLGGLLGDDGQDGLVPGILDGLLGGG